MPRRPPILRRTRTLVLYLAALLREFRWTFLLLALALALGTPLYLHSPAEFDNKHPTVADAMFAVWMAMLAQPIKAPPESGAVTVLCTLYPVVGFIVIGEGVVRLALLMFSRRHGLKEWIKVMASTYRGHVVVAGVGKLGIKVIEQFLGANLDVVAIEKDETARMLPQARALGVPVIVGDMKDDQTLLDAGIPHAAVVVIATNDDMANLEVALDSRRLNPRIRVVMRLFEQPIARKIANAFLVDAAFSASTLAAPIVAAMSLGSKVLSSTLIANIPHVSAELTLAPSSPLAGKTIDEAERGYCCKVLARTPASGPAQLPPAGATVLAPGDLLVVHTPSSQLTTLAAAATAGPP